MSTSPSTRWWVAPPQPGETLASLVARAASLYHCSAESLWLNLETGGPALGPMDAPTLHGLRRVGEAIGLAPKGLVKQRLYDDPWRLLPDARHAVCPVCVDQEAQEDSPPRYRADWTRVLVPTCSRHGAGLRLACGSIGRRATDLSGDPDDLSDTDRAVLALIQLFGETLERALYFGGSWPTSWRGNPSTARAWMLRACLHRGPDADAVPISNVRPQGALACWVHGPTHLMPPVRVGAWDAFRAIADPAHRRAALWAGAWLVVPGLDSELSPGWYDWESLRLAPAPWEQPRRRMRRAAPGLAGRKEGLLTELTHERGGTSHRGGL